MSIFGSKSDFSLIRRMNRELLREIIEQEVGYYKISLQDTQANIYGESLQKTFLPPVLINCSICLALSCSALSSASARQKFSDSGRSAGQQTQKGSCKATVHQSQFHLESAR